MRGRIGRWGRAIVALWGGGPRPEGTRLRSLSDRQLRDAGIDPVAAGRGYAVDVPPQAVAKVTGYG